MYIPKSLFCLLYLPEEILELLWDLYWDNEYRRVVRMLNEGYPNNDLIGRTEHVYGNP